MGSFPEIPAAKVTRAHNTDVEASNEADTYNLEGVDNPQWKLSSDANDGDTSLALFSNQNELREKLDPIKEWELCRKIDCMILPYAFFYIDKTTFRFSAIFGHLTQQVLTVLASSLSAAGP